MLDFSQYSALTFDCYGTLIDWEGGILSALRPLLTAQGVSLSEESLLETYGELEAKQEAGEFQNYRAILRGVVEGFGERYGFAVNEAVRNAIVDSFDRWLPFPDTVEALARLGERFSLNVISNVDDDLFALSAKHLKADFRNVVTAQRVGSYKPNLRNFEVALQTLNLPKERVLHVAQSLYHDIAPANQLGIASVWVNRRQGSTGAGATPSANAVPNLEVPDLKTLAEFVERGAES